MTSRSEWLALCAVLLLTCCCHPRIIEETDEPSPTDIVGEGTLSSPYSVADAQQVASADDVWVCGYIVGAVSGSIQSGCVWSVPTSVSANILLADDTLARDSRRVLPVQLTASKYVRSRLNLAAHPELLHRQVFVRGTLGTYYDVPGIRDITAYRLAGGEEVSGDVTVEDEWGGVITCPR